LLDHPERRRRVDRMALVMLHVQKVTAHDFERLRDGP
jgi:hypothetical protein